MRGKRLLLEGLNGKGKGGKRGREGSGREMKERRKIRRDGGWGDGVKLLAFEVKKKERG